jgi:ketosteroid isomerase-like protein
MLRSLKVLGISGVMLVTAMACQQQATEQSGATEEDIAPGADVAATIDESNTAFEQAMLTGNVDGMIVGYAPDAVVQPPMMPASSGTESIRALYAGMVEDGPPASFDIVSDNVIVAESGELAYETGHYTVSGQTPEGEVWEDQGKYMTVWKKNAEGQWQTAALSWSPNATPPAMDHAEGEAKATAPSTETAPEAGTTDPAPAGETN